MTGIAPSRATRGIRETPADTLDTSSMNTAKASELSPAPPNFSGYPTAISSFSIRTRWMSWGNSSVSSISVARGPIRSSQTARTALRKVSSSSGSVNGSVTALRTANDQRVALAAAATERRPGVLGSPATHLVARRQHQPGAAHPDGVPQSHRAAVRVHPVVVHAKHPRGVESHGGERLVDLDHAEVAGRDTGLLQGRLHGQRRHRVEVRESLGAHPVSHDL